MNFAVLRHPYVPILPKKYIARSIPKQTRATVSHEPECYFSSDINGDDVKNIAFRTICNSLQFFVIPRPFRPNFQIETPSHFLDLRPGLFTVVLEQIGVECYAA